MKLKNNIENNLFFYNQVKKRNEERRTNHFWLGLCYDKKHNNYYEFVTFIFNLDTLANNQEIIVDVTMIEKEKGKVSLFFNIEKSGDFKSKLEYFDSCSIFREIYLLFKDLLGKKIAIKAFSRKNICSIINKLGERIEVTIDDSELIFRDAWFSYLKLKGLEYKEFERTFELLTKTRIRKHYINKEEDLIILSTKKDEDWLNLIELEHGV